MVSPSSLRGPRTGVIGPRELSLEEEGLLRKKQAVLPAPSLQEMII